MFFSRLRLDKAIGTGVAVLAASSIAGFVFHSDLGGIPWELLMFTVPGVILGGHYGVKIAKYLESTFSQSADQLFKKSPLKLIFAMVILVDCIVILLLEYII